MTLLKSELQERASKSKKTFTHLVSNHYYLNLVESKTAPLLFTRLIENFSTVSARRQLNSNQEKNVRNHWNKDWKGRKKEIERKIMERITNQVVQE